MKIQSHVDFPLPHTKILGIPLFAGSISQMVTHVLKTCARSNKSSRCVSATGAHGLVIAQEDKKFSDTLRNFYANLPDGRPSVWISHLKGVKTMRQCPGGDFFEALITKSAATQVTHYFCGGNEGVAQKLKQHCQKKFNNNNILGTYTPPFRLMTDDELHALAEHINQLSPDVLWIGISTPKQELFAERIAPLLKVHFIFCVGAAFDFYSGNLKRAPRLIQVMGIEWLYRLIKEPKRLYKRTLTVVPKFIVFNFMELFNSLTPKKVKGEQYE